MQGDHLLNIQFASIILRLVTKFPNYVLKDEEVFTQMT